MSSWYPRAFFDRFTTQRMIKSTHAGRQSPDATELLILPKSNNDRHNTLQLRTTLSHDCRDPKTFHDEINQMPTKRRRSSGGWRAGALNFALCTTIVFAMNLSLTIWGFTTYKFNGGVFMETNCADVKKWNSGLHVVINMFSTILLGGSNYCMQVLSAPTRKNIDEAHAKGRSLDVGVPSLRNLRHLGWKRAFLWLLFGLSSLPLHLLYNSIVFATTSSTDYKVFVANQAFLDDGECNNCTYPELELLWSNSKSSGGLERLETAQCFAEYSTSIQNKWRNLLIITSDDNYVRDRGYISPHDGIFSDKYEPVYTTNVYRMFRFDAMIATHAAWRWEQPYHWLLSGDDSDRSPPEALAKLQQAPGNWSVGAIYLETPDAPEITFAKWPVEYCLSERAAPHCKLRFSRGVAIIVTCLNLGKAILMYFLVYSFKNDPMITTGDAIASFMKVGDDTTKDLSLFDFQDKRNSHKSQGKKEWRNNTLRWKDATSKTRRAITIAMFSIAVIAILTLFIWATKEMTRISSVSLSEALRIGIGAVDTRALIEAWTVSQDPTVLALIANTPQVVLSILYFLYNGHFTAMLGGREWTSYAHERKGLRVSHRPRGQQRSTYFLQLPYRFGVPLAFLSGVLHWLVSQSIFVVAIDAYTSYGDLIHGYAHRTCGYSPPAMLAVIILGGFLTIAMIAVGFLPYKRGIPLAGSSSMAISAACHSRGAALTDEAQLCEQKLQWGVVRTDENGVGHCAFSSQAVLPLMEGSVYR